MEWANSARRRMIRGVELGGVGGKGFGTDGGGGRTRTGRVNSDIESTARVDWAVGEYGGRIALSHA